MKEKFDKHQEVWKFVGKTVFYLVIILALLFLYSYSRTGGAHFIYNDF